MPGYPGGIWCGDQGPPPTLQILGDATDGGTGGRVLRKKLPRGEKCDTGVLILSTIFNVAVGAVIRHWEYLSEEEDRGNNKDNISCN